MTIREVLNSTEEEKDHEQEINQLLDQLLEEAEKSKKYAERSMQKSKTYASAFDTSDWNHIHYTQEITQALYEAVQTVQKQNLAILTILKELYKR